MESDLELAERVARDAGLRLLELRTSYGELDPVDLDRIRALRSEADLMAHNLITTALREARPDDAILSEEGKDDPGRDAADRVWIVDPLDGTAEYGEGRSDFAVHVALWERSAGPAGGLTAGVVDLPDQDRCGTTGDRVELSFPFRPGAPLRMVVSRSRPPAAAQDLDLLAERLRAEGLDTPAVELMSVGSVGCKVSELLTGDADVYLHDSGFYEWDVAAPLAVAAHCGLAACHVDGSEVTFNHRPPWVANLVVGDPAVVAALTAAIDS